MPEQKQTRKPRGWLPPGSKETSVLSVPIPPTKHKTPDDLSLVVLRLLDAGFHNVEKFRGGANYVFRTDQGDPNEQVLEVYRVLGYNRLSGVAYLQEAPRMRNQIQERVSKVRIRLQQPLSQNTAVSSLDPRERVYQTVGDVILAHLIPDLTQKELGKQLYQKLGFGSPISGQGYIHNLVNGNDTGGTLRETESSRAKRLQRLAVVLDHINIEENDPLIADVHSIEPDFQYKRDRITTISQRK